MSGAVVLLGIAIGAAQEVVASPGRSSTAPMASGAALRGLALAASLLLLAACVLAITTASSVLLACAGAGALTAGGWLRAEAMRSLGSQFRTEAGADVLVATGIHGVMRHPSELGLLAWTLGLFVASPSLFALILALAQLPLLALRLRIEELALAEQFGEAWRRYAADTPRFGF